MRFRKDRRVPAVRRWLPGLGLLGLCAGVGEEAPLPTEANPKRFLGKSLEELAQIEVVSVNRREQPLQNLPAAVAVITGEDIRRTRVTTIADALRLAPGTDVARVGSPDWAVLIRGFNDTFANKLLVLMDGRSVYTPLFSGTFWHVQDTLLQDIDRIEVIRGRGGTVWGANAVNGVVNVVTKPASQTQGLLVSGGGGTFDQVLADLRYGGP